LTEFFEIPPPPPPPERYRPPAWIAAPDDTLPGIVALQLVLAHTDNVAVYISHLEAYPSGFALTLLGIAQEDNEYDPPLLSLRAGMGQADQQKIAEEMLRFGVEFADGSKATNLDASPLDLDDLTKEPPGPVLHGARGNGIRPRIAATHVDLATPAPRPPHLRMRMAARRHPAHPPRHRRTTDPRRRRTLTSPIPKHLTVKGRS
jgi:hypothetical protein